MEERIIKLLEDLSELMQALMLPQEDHMLDTREAAAYLLVSYDTLLRWVKEGKIPCSRPGRRVLFSKQGLDKWRADQERASTIRIEESLVGKGYGTLRKIAE